MQRSDVITTGFFWLLSGTVVQNLAKILIVAILSRLIAPEVFGVIAIALSFIGLSELLTQLSLSQALVTLKFVTESHKRVAFTFSILSTLVLSILSISVVNPIISTFYNYPGLLEVLNVLVITYPIRGFSMLSFALLQRDKRFKELAGLETVSYIIGYGILSIILAYLGWGVWSLVIGTIASSLINSLLLYSRVRFRISFAFHYSSFRDLFSFGSKFSLIKLINYGALKGDYLVIGKVLGAYDVGLYSRAYALMDSVNSIVGKVLNTVLLPVFAEINDKDESNNLTLKILAVIFNLLIPLAVLLIIYSKYVIGLILGDEWLGATLIFQIIMTAMVARVGYKTISTILIGVGKINVNLKVQVIYLSLVILLSFLGSFYFGLVGAAAGVTIAINIIFVIFLTVKIRISSLNWLSVLRSTKSGLLLAILCVVINSPLYYYFSEYSYFLLLALVINLFVLLIVIAYFKSFFFEKILIGSFNKIYK